MEGDVRKTGIAAVGDCRWGTHFCLFYRTQQDLIDILVPYFKAGLENNEFCMWVTSEPLQVEEARSALAQAVGGLEDYLRRGQVEILDYTQWYLQSGKFEADRVLQGWVEKERQAIGRGWDGLRLTGNTFWLEKEDWRAFADYEAAVNAVIGRHRMVALCTYSLDRCGTAEILDVVATHQFALIEQEGQWRTIESGERRWAEKEISRRNRDLSVLYQISQATVQSLDLQETLHQALGATLEALEVEVGAIYLMEPDGETMTLRASQGHAEAFVKAVQCLKRGEGISGKAVAEGRPVALDVSHYPSARLAPAVIGEGLQTLASTPLLSAGEAVGALSLGSRRARAFPPEELQLLAAIGHQLGHCIERARLVDAVQRELSERRRAEELLREANQRKDEFLAMLAHEIRNPLGAMSNTVEMVCLRPKADPICGEVHAILRRQMQQVTRLLDDLLDVSRITLGKIALKKEPVDLAAVVAQAVETMRPRIEAREHDLQVSLPARPVRLEVDPARLEQVLMNLLGNAAKYTEPGGRIWLSAERQRDQAVVRVRDTGVGIPPELLPKVFDLFVQADRSLDRSQGGLGVGLTLVRNLVEMHGGSVEAYSAGPGQGSEFIVRLPALPGASRSRVPGRQPVASEEISGRPRRILVVDDNLDAAKMLALCLEMWGHQVQVTHDGLTAIEMAMAYRPEVVLLDLGLPGMDGYEVARRLRQQAGLSRARLVALTGYGHEEARRRSLETGFDRHLVKPVGVAELQRLLVTLPEGS